MAPGATIDLILAENPSTGYSWNIDKASAHNIWQVVSEEQTKEATEESHDGMGAPGAKKVTIRMG